MDDEYDLNGDEDLWLYVKHPTQGHDVGIHIIFGPDGITVDAWNDVEAEAPVASIGTPRKRGMLAWDDELSTEATY